jgi:tetratricopeptide (TPR) repeat protein
MADVALAAFSENKPRPYFQFAKGLADYRQGRFESAAEWMQKVAAAKGDLYRGVQAEMVLAMAQRRLGKTDQARDTFAKALETADTRFPKAGKSSLDDQWNDWVIAHAFMREAKALLQADAAGTRP